MPRGKERWQRAKKDAYWRQYRPKWARGGAIAFGIEIRRFGRVVASVGRDRSPDIAAAISTSLESDGDAVD